MTTTDKAPTKALTRVEHATALGMLLDHNVVVCDRLKAHEALLAAAREWAAHVVRAGDGVAVATPAYKDFNDAEGALFDAIKDMGDA